MISQYQHVRLKYSKYQQNLKESYNWHNRIYEEQENQIKNIQKIPILKAGNMSLGVNLLMYLTEIASKSLTDEYLSKIFEIHHKHKKTIHPVLH